MKEKLRKLYWDAGVFCSFFNAKFEPERARIVHELLKEAESGMISIITSTISLVEVLKLDRAHPLTKDAEGKIIAFFEKPYIQLVAADRLICEEARHLIWKYPALEYKDAIHLASAIQFSNHMALDGLFAWDTDFTKLNQKITTKFRITEPVVDEPSLESWARENAEKEKAALPDGEAPPVDPPVSNPEET